MEEKKSWEQKVADETLWLKISVRLAIAVVVGFLAAIVFVCYPSGDNEKVTIHLAIVSTFGAALFALLTFATIVWRGLVSARQADEQKRANNLKDEESRTQRFIEASNILGEGNPETAGAAIGLLSTVVQNSLSEFRQPAFEILGSFLRKNIDDQNYASAVELARVAMISGARVGLKSDLDLTVKCNIVIHLFLGFRHVQYMGGTYQDTTLDYFNGVTSYSFKKTTFQNTEINGQPFHFDKCSFRKCKIGDMSHFSLMSGGFVECEFVGTKFNLAILKTHSFEKQIKNCFYYRDSPPTGDGAHLILPYLEARDRTTT